MPPIRPVLLVTSDVPPDRVAPLQALHARIPIVVARFGGTRRHATSGVRAVEGVPVLDVTERQVLRLAAARARHRAVIAGTVGKLALPSAYAGARAARVPFVLWSALWNQPHRVSAPLMRHLYRHADAVAAYGEHVARYARHHGARNVHLAPQAVDPAFWSARPATRDQRGTPPFTALFVGRVEHEKGAGILLDAWRRTGLRPPAATLEMVGPGSVDAFGGQVQEDLGVRLAGSQPAAEVRNFLGRADVLVVPSIATPSFREPWALVVNEAMHQQLPVIATDAVGAVAGGLVQHERNGLVVPAGDAPALAAAIERLAGDAALRAQLGANGGHDVAALTPEAWAEGMVQALRSVEVTA